MKDYCGRINRTSVLICAAKITQYYFFDQTSDNTTSLIAKKLGITKPRKIVEEAGGRVTDIYGKELDFGLGRKLFSNRGILASNGKLHRVVLESINMLLND